MVHIVDRQVGAVGPQQFEQEVGAGFTHQDFWMNFSEFDTSLGYNTADDSAVLRKLEHTEQQLPCWQIIEDFVQHIAGQTADGVERVASDWRC